MTPPARAELETPDKVPFRPVVVAPTYNNAGTVLDVLRRVLAIGLPTIVVDDGCTDSTAALLEQWRAADDAPSGALEVVRHERNRGKAQALRTGFATAAARGYSHAVSIDTDGQLDPESIPALLAVARRVPAALVLGVRASHIDGCPARSMVGRRLSNLAIRCECGVRVQDSQCGLRVYPLDLVAGAHAVACRAGRFAYEAEIITRAVWAGRPIEQVPVPCRYLPPETRVSHFKPWRDSLHGVRLHARLLGAALLPRKRQARTADTHPEEKRAWRRAGVWLSPLRLWREVRHAEGGPTETALGFSIGVFIANLPLYGVHALLGLYAAHRLHLHPVPVVAGSFVSTPPLGLLLIGAAIGVGHLLTHGTWIWTDMAQAHALGSWRLLEWALVDWITGSVIVGLATAVAAFVLMWPLLRVLARRARDAAGEPHG